MVSQTTSPMADDAPSVLHPLGDWLALTMGDACGIGPEIIAKAWAMGELGGAVICADMAVRCAVARSQLYYAACALDAGSGDAGFHVAAAQRLADTAALDNGRANVQVHGGIGMTDEAYPHLTLKRAHLLGFIAPVSSSDLLLPELELA